MYEVLLHIPNVFAALQRVVHNLFVCILFNLYFRLELYMKRMYKWGDIQNSKDKTYILLICYIYVSFFIAFNHRQSMVKELHFNSFQTNLSTA